MKRFFTPFIAALALVAVSACSKVPVGHVGVKVDKLGSDNAVNEEVVGVGYEFIPPTQELHIFPTFTQNEEWTSDSRRGSKTDESVSFQTRGGLVVSADIGMSYYVDPEKVDILFQKYRRGIHEITDVYLRNMVRDALVEGGSVMPIEAVYGEGKVTLMKNAQANVQAQVKQFGINIEKLYWIGEMNLPPSVVQSIDAKIRATQVAQERENQIQTANAEAQIKIAESKGRAEAILIEAKAKADALDLEGDAIARNPQVIELRSVESWNGQLPTYMGSGAVPFINVNK